MHMDNPGSAETASRALSGKVVDSKALVVRQRSQAPGSGGGGGPGKLPVVLCCAACPRLWLVGRTWRICLNCWCNRGPHRQW